MADSEGSRELITQGELGYTSVKIFTTNPLGTGSYGAVYKARCDELSCAAKLLHSALFQFNDPGVQITTQRFEQECEVLSSTKHPCIVQYLGTAKDPETGRLVLLMELMDESLTMFLKRSTGLLLYHIQVNLCHDIALALAYLHSKSIVHRDLSSNNVLLIAGSRAKVTDFGMAKLVDTNPHTTPLTQCPGTAVYMPPEALTAPPQYTEKLDCFSAGVLTVQIVTCQFPEPGPGFRVVRDQRYPTGKVHVPLPEVERRKNAISLIDEAHPLLPITLRCLKDDEKERPLAREICHCLAALKELQQYCQSVQQPHDQQEVHLRDQEIEMKQKELECKDLVIAVKVRACEKLMREVDEKNSEIEARSREIEHLTQQLQTLEAKSRTDNEQICTIPRRDKQDSLGRNRERSASGTVSPSETVQVRSHKHCYHTILSSFSPDVSLVSAQTSTPTGAERLVVCVTFLVRGVSNVGIPRM